MRRIVLAACTLLLAAGSAIAEPTSMKSANDFATTLDKLRAAIEASPASVIHEVDHAEGAMSADMELPPTTLVIFGNPAAGTQLMKADRMAALALPMKMLVTETDEGVMVVYEDPKMLAEEFELGDAAMVTEKMSGLVGMLAEAATK